MTGYEPPLVRQIERLEHRIADLERQLSTARADGRADGLREAALVAFCFMWPGGRQIGPSEPIANAIRALIPPQEKT